MAGALKTTSLLPPARGIDADSGPWSVARDRAPVLRNFITGRSGRIIMRGPSTLGISTGVSGFKTPISLIPFLNKSIQVWYRSRLAGNGYCDPWLAYQVPQTSATALSYSNADNGHWFDFDAVSKTDLVHAFQLTPGPRFDYLTNNVWGVGYTSIDDVDNTGIILLNGKRYRATEVLVRTTTPSAAAFASWGRTTAPVGAIDLKIFAGRIFLVGGAVWGGAAYTLFSPNHLRFSIPYPNLGAAALTDWQDPVTGAWNTILVGEDTVGAALVGIAQVGRGLLCLKYNSTHILTGAGPSTFATRQIAGAIGCIDQHSICEVSDGVMWISQHGFMFYDGANITNITDGVARTAFQKAQEILEADRGDPGLSTTGKVGAQVQITAMGPDHALVTITSMNHDSGAAHPWATTHYALLYNLRSRSWSEVTFEQTTPGTCPGGAFCLSRGPVIHASSQLLNETFGYGFNDDLATPYAQAQRIDRWPVPEDASTTWTTYMGSDGTRSIPAEWKSGLVELASPTNKSMVKRLILEYTFQVKNDVDEGADAWYVSLLDENGTVIVPEYQVTTQQDPVLEVATRRHFQDIFVETKVEAVQLRVRYTGAARQILKAEIMGAWVEHQPAQEHHA